MAGNHFTHSSLPILVQEQILAFDAGSQVPLDGMGSIFNHHLVDGTGAVASLCGLCFR